MAESVEQPSQPAAGRLAAIDVIKAAAIVAVVFQHSGVSFLDPRYGVWDRALRSTWGAFHVPAFLLVAGFLYARAEPIGLPEIRRRLGRVLVPYLILSPIAWWITQPGHGLLFALATGSASGIYYFIFVLVGCIAFSWLLSRLPHPVL